MPSLPPQRARQLFAAERVARLATADQHGVPHLVPVTFAVAGDTVLTAVDHKPKTTQRLRRLRNIAANPAVCLLADRYTEAWDRLWWVRADGSARIEPPGTAGHRDGVAALTARYPQYQARPPAGPLVVITVSRWRGWTAADQP